jgi:RNA polymerase sigma factor (sigma-70 family)
LYSEVGPSTLLFAGWTPAGGVIHTMGPDLLGRLLDSHAAALTLYARQWCAIPEDIVQEAFLKLAIQSTPPANPVSWLYCVVRNGAISAARKDTRRHRHESIAAARTPAWFAPTDGVGLDIDAATAALQDLPLEQREVIIAHLWGGLTFEQIAPLVDTTSSTAHRWYMAGLSALRERLGVECPIRSAIKH